MLLVAVVVVLASAPASVESRGEGPPIASLRSRARPSFAVAPAISLVPWETGPALGAGAMLEVGLILSDRFALSLHFEGTLLLPTPTDSKPRGLLLLGGLTLDWLLNDRWSVGGASRADISSARSRRPSWLHCARAGASARESRRPLRGRA